MPRSRKPRHSVALVAGVALAAALTTSACGGTVEVPTPSGSRTVQLPSVSVPVPSISVPSIPVPTITRPTAGESPETTAPPETTAAPEPTETETAEPTAEPTPTPEPTETVTETATATPSPTETETPSPTPSPSQTDVAAPAPEDEDGGIPAWAWWLAAALALAAAVVLIVRGRRRAAWDDDLTAAEAEMTWLARDLLPRMRATGSREAAAGAWAVSMDRVQALEDRLTWLEATAPSEPRRVRAELLRDAVRDAHARSTALGHPGPVAGFTTEVDAVVATLEGALARTPER